MKEIEAKAALETRQITETVDALVKKGEEAARLATLADMRLQEQYEKAVKTAQEDAKQAKLVLKIQEKTLKRAEQDAFDKYYENECEGQKKNAKSVKGIYGHAYNTYKSRAF